ncbi:TPA: restriction endonuclease subunit S [Proteus mirabilis]|uniref:restriction endonuclease subunit S n=1 Tax=Providencia stuartii TaxID=588 RepID=UPI000CE67C98|nr:restriction endonuclease subunit S [Providencia stuartii]AVE43246.1 restriction endonuclease subunit S [Providencia stuartii]HEK0656673.1 restriction endonuclease subunit S [Proteus mirabilis]
MSEWHKTLLGKIVEITNGYAFKSINFSNVFSEGSLPVVKIRNVANGDVNLDNVQYHKTDKKLSKYISVKGDILIAMTGNHPQALTQVVGAVSKQKINQQLYINQRVAKISSLPTLSIDDFIYYYLKDESVHEYLANQSSGSANQANISKSDIENLELFIPCVQEQKAITSVLSSLDDKIDLLHRQNKTLESMAETLFRQWFVEEVQDDWEEKKFSDLFEIRDGTHDSPKQALRGYPLITSKHIDVWSLKFNDAYLISESDYDAVNKRSKVEQYDILFSMIGTLGRTYIESSDDINYAIKNIGLFKTSQNPNWKYFTYLWLVSENGKVFIDENKSGSTQEYISLGSLRSIKFMSPPLEILKEFNLAVEGFFNKIFFNVKNIQTLENLRDTLLPKLMSGEVRVNYTPEEIKQ